MSTTLSDLESAYPELCAQLVARGRDAERARVLQHLRLGAHGVDYQLAHSSIESGAELSPELAEEYLTQRMKRMMSDARQADSDYADSVLCGFTPRPPTTSRDAVADEVDRLMSAHSGDPTPQPRNLIR